MGRDSNPRYEFTPYDGLANRWFKPLTHPSGPNGFSRAKVGFLAPYVQILNALFSPAKNYPPKLSLIFFSNSSIATRKAGSVSIMSWTVRQE
jgi:hypothetical protein